MIDLEKKTFKEKLVSWYETLSASKRKNLTLFAGGAGLLVIATILVIATSDDTKKLIEKKRKVEYSLFNGKSPKAVSVDAMAGKIKKLTEDFSVIRDSFERQDQKIEAATEMIKKRSEELSKRTEKLAEQTNELFEKLEVAQENLKNQVPLPEIPLDKKPNGKRKTRNSGFEDPALLGQPPTMAQSEVAPAETGPKIRVVTGSGEDGKATKTGNTPEGVQKAGTRKITEYVNIKRPASNGVPDMFLSAGSIISGTLITGLDAPTANQSKQDPFPALLRIKHEAILPNRYRMDIRECFLIASGYGDLSSERAYMRAERISCVKKDGGIIETAMDAYSVGEDGKAGIRGRLVSKNGQLIAMTLLSGFVSGISQAFAPQSVQTFQTGNSPSSQQNFQWPSPEAVAGQAAMGGVSTAAEQIANYYLEMAKNIFPIIEIDAGRKVDFVMVRGMSLNPKSRSAQGFNSQGGVRNTNNNFSGNSQNRGSRNQMMSGMVNEMMNGGSNQGSGQSSYFYNQ